MINRIIMKLFFRILHKDKEYRLAWHDNLAMMAYDAGAESIKANEWAGQFMCNLIGIDTYWEWKKRKEFNRNSGII